MLPEPEMWTPSEITDPPGSGAWYSAKTVVRLLEDARSDERRKMTDQVAGEWVVNVFGARGSPAWEISVVRKSNSHGLGSWGWFGPDKLRISDNGGPHKHPLPGLVWDRQIELADQICARLNAGLGVE